MSALKTSPILRIPFSSWLVFAIVLGCLSGCESSRGIESWPPSYGVAERASHQDDATFRKRNWRDAIRLPASSRAHTIDLGLIGEARAVRLGIMLSQSDPTGANIRVRVNDEEVASISELDAVVWNEHLIELGDVGEFSPTDRCSVVFDIKESYWVAPLELVELESDPPQNVLVFLVDTLRADHCGVYGYERETTPNLDRFAETGTVFENMISVSPWTRPAVASLLSGTFGSTHGAETITDTMRSEVPRIADILKQEGYSTYAFAHNANVHPYWGIGGEFFNYGLFGKDEEDKNVMAAVERTLPALKGEKWFMYVHLLDPHHAYRPPTVLFGPYAGEGPETYTDKILHRMLGEDVRYRNMATNNFGFSAREFEEARAATAGTDYVPDSLEDLVRESKDFYDSEIVVSDTYFQRVLDLLDASGQLDNTLIVFLSDHGEEFFEHGNSLHGKTLYDEVVRVPLVIRAPGGNKSVNRVDSVVQTVDVAPTILELLGLDVPEAMEGVSLVPLLSGDSLEERVAYMSLIQRSEPRKNLSAAIHGDSKVIVDHLTDTYAWYDLASDPLESSPLAEPLPGSEELVARVDSLRSRSRHGLHLVLTSPIIEGEKDVYEGTLTVPGLRSFELRYPPERATSSRDGDTVTFRIEMHDSEMLWRFHLATHAELYVDADFDAGFALALTLNGARIPEIKVPTVGAPKTVAISDDVLPFGTLIAPADKSDIGFVPADDGVYGWFIPPVDSMGVDEMDAEMRETLEGMGYL